MRSGTLSDTEAVLSLFRAARPPLSPDHLHRCITTVPWVVAHAADGNLVGFAYGVEFAPDIVELSNLYVHPEFRDKSTGGALLDWFESEASLAGYVGVILTNSQYYSSPEKRDASLFYERHGYAPVITTGPTIVWFKAIQVTVQSVGSVGIFATGLVFLSRERLSGLSVVRIVSSGSGRGHDSNADRARARILASV